MARARKPRPLQVSFQNQPNRRSCDTTPENQNRLLPPTNRSGCRQVFVNPYSLAKQNTAMVPKLSTPRGRRTPQMHVLAEQQQQQSAKLVQYPRSETSDDCLPNKGPLLLSAVRGSTSYLSLYRSPACVVTDAATTVRALPCPPHKSPHLPLPIA